MSSGSAKRPSGMRREHRGGLGLVAPGLDRHRGQGDGRVDGVDADAAGAELHGHDAGQAVEAGLGGAVGGVVAEADEGGHAGDVDDGALAAVGDQGAGVFLGDDHRRAGVDRVEQVEVLLGRSRKAVELGGAGVVDEKVGRQRRAGGGAGRLGVGEVDGDASGSRSRRRGSARSPARAGEGDDLGAAAGEHHARWRGRCPCRRR